MCMRHVHTILLLLLVISRCTLVHDSATGGWDLYDEHCQQLVLHAKGAAAWYNKGEAEKAQEELDAATAAFYRAVEVAPGEPQAYIDMATFMLNIHRFNASLDYWRHALDLVQGDVYWRQVVEHRIKYTTYGYCSHQRDQAYRQGKGDYAAALHWAHRQLQLLPSAQVLHEAATLEVMLGERDPALRATALRHYREAQALAVRAWLEGLRASNTRCDDARSGVVQGWAREGQPVHPEDMALHNTLSTKRAVYGAEVLVYSAEAGAGPRRAPFRFTEQATYIARFRDVAVAGNDAVIVALDPAAARCRLYVPSAGAYINLAENVPTLTPVALSPEPQWHRPFPGRGPPKGVASVSKAALVTSFAGSSYYHWVMEGLGRLLLLLPLVQEDPAVKLILPKDTSSQKFIFEFLRLLPFRIPRTRILWHDVRGWNDLRFRVGTLYFANWDQVLLTAAGPEAQSLHCLMPRYGLQLVRKTFVPHEVPATSRNAVIVCSRRADSMRSSPQESELVERLEAWVGQHPHYKLHVFTGTESSPSATIELFSRAAIVLGVHGGALANIVFCAPGTQIIELGFATPQSWHYAHAAQALDLSYTLVHVSAQDSGIASPTVSIDVELVLSVVAARRTEYETYHDEL